MKSRHLIALFLSTVVLAEEPKATPNPEIARIDARLSELAEIWRQDDRTINKLTNFKRTPVQEGTRAYYQYMQAWERTQQTEAEAKSLKTEKEALQQANELAIQEEAKKIAALQQANELAIQEEAEIKSKNIPDVVYEKTVHGPKVKGMFINMSIMQLAKAAKELGTKCYPGVNLISKFNREDTGYSFTLSNPSGPFGMNEVLINGNSDVGGKVVHIGFIDITSKAFNLNDMKIDEFAKSFSENYDVSLDPRMDQDIVMKLMGKNDLSLNYRGTTEEGVLIKIFTIDRGLPLLRVFLDKTASSKDLKKAFD